MLDHYETFTWIWPRDKGEQPRIEELAIRIEWGRDGNWLTVELEDDAGNALCQRGFEVRARDVGLSGLVPQLVDNTGCPCNDCGVLTAEIGEWYMLRGDVWRSAVPEARELNDESGYLCVGCMEARLGRELTLADFTEKWRSGPYSERFREQSSERLRSRMRE